MKQVIQKQEVQKEILGMPIIDEQFSQIGLEADLSMQIEQAERSPRRLLVRPFLDFKDEEKHLQAAIDHEKKDKEDKQKFKRLANG